MIRGIDVSAHQGEVDWRAVARSGVRFAFIRAFEGKDMDPTFERNRREALAAGLLVGSYSYLRARHPGRWQAELLLAALGDLQPGELPPVVDVETLDKRTPPEAQACLLGWIEVMRSMIGRDPIVYTYPFFWRDELRGGVVSEVARCPLWIADYRARKAPEVPVPWSGAVCWQTSGTGECPGVKGPVDLNTWLDGELEAFAGARC